MAALGRLWGGLDASWPASGRSRLLLDRSGAVLDGLGRLPGPILTALGRLLGTRDRLFERSWRHRTLVWPTDRKSSTVQRFRWFLQVSRCLRGDASSAFGGPWSPLGRSRGAPSLSVAGQGCPGRRLEPLRRPGGAPQERAAAVSATVRAKTSISGPSQTAGPRRT